MEIVYLYILFEDTFHDYEIEQYIYHIQIVYTKEAYDQIHWEVFFISFKLAENSFV